MRVAELGLHARRIDDTDVDFRLGFPVAACGGRLSTGKLRAGFDIAFQRAVKPSRPPDATVQSASGSVASTGSSFAASSARSEEHTSELQSLMRISYAVFCLKKKIKKTYNEN